MQNRLIKSLEAEAAILTGFVDATLAPSIALLNCKVIAHEMESEVMAYERAKGKTESSERSSERIGKLLDNLEKLDAVANQNNTYHLIARHAQVQLHNLQLENWKLKKELEAINKALNAE